MANTARLYKIDMLIRHRGQVSFADLRQALEVSPATLKRDLEYLRDRLGAPIVYDRDVNGYRFATAASGPAAAARPTMSARSEPRQELPGLWFSQRELYALLMAHQLLSGLDSEGLIARHMQPLLDRIQDLLGPGGEGELRTLRRRVKIVGAATRPVAGEWFQRAGEALMRRHRLHLVYFTRSRGEAGEREVSPQRLVHYRSTWYLDAWCHRRDKLLRFALDAVQSARVLDARAKDVPMRQVQAEMDAGYGIYAGGTRQVAVLHFNPRAAAWISGEQWHPEQQGRRLDDGSWELRLPYVDETELVMDILRHGDQVRVLAPDSLRDAVARRLAAAAAQYAGMPESCLLLAKGKT